MDQTQDPSSTQGTGTDQVKLIPHREKNEKSFQNGLVEEDMKAWETWSMFGRNQTKASTHPTRPRVSAITSLIP